MSDLKLTVNYSANGGVCLSWPDGEKIWTDLYPDFKTNDFSFIDDGQWEVIKKDGRFSPPALVLATHLHPDHFSSKRTSEIRSMWPNVPVVIPEGSAYSGSYGGYISSYGIDASLVSGSTYDYRLREIYVRFIRTVHSGRAYASVPHYSLIIRHMGKTVFISGDASPAGEELSLSLEGLRPDLAVLNFPWASIGRAREAVVRSLKPAHVLLVHIPNLEDDRQHYREIAINCAGLLDIPDVRLMLTPMQEESFSL